MIIYAHLGTILPAIFLGPYVLIKPKGDKLHKRVGKIWATLMIVSSLLSFGIFSPKGGLSWLHGLAAYTIYSIIMGIKDAREGNLTSHKRRMTGPYIGACIAMIFALSGEGRLLNAWIRSLIE